MENNHLWEPLWQLSTRLNPAELELLELPLMKRLDKIHQGGAEYISTKMRFSRLQHTHGVFSLVAFLLPDNSELRVASLLHDIGHFPFSHALESIQGVNHHTKTEELLTEISIDRILKKYGLNASEITAYMNGTLVSPLRNQVSVLQLDHLDSWIRTAHLLSKLSISPIEIRNQLRVINGYIDMNTSIAEKVSRIIFAEAEFHCSVENMGPNTVICDLIRQLISAGQLTVEEIFLKSEDELIDLLSEHEITSKLIQRLLQSPNQLKQSRTREQWLEGEIYEVNVKKLYLSLPLTNGKRIDEINDTIANELLNLNELFGTYYIYWTR